MIAGQYISLPGIRRPIHRGYRLRHCRRLAQDGAVKSRINAEAVIISGNCYFGRQVGSLCKPYSDTRRSYIRWAVERCLGGRFSL